MRDLLWLYAVLFGTAGWVGGILTQAVVGEAVDRRAFRRLTEVREALDAEYGRPLPNPEAQIAQASARFSSPASTRTRPSRAARTPDPASSA